MKHILAIDQGTTGSRAILFDVAGREVASAYEPVRQIYPEPGWVEHDPDDIWQGVTSCIRRALAGTRGAEVAAIGITNQRETTFLWERETLRPVANAIVWQCRRTSDRCDEIRRDVQLAERITELTGLPVDAYFSASKLEWMLRQTPGAQEAAGRGELAAGTSDSWLVAKLTGGRVHATDYTNASRTMLLDIERRQWADELLHLFAVPRSLLPQVKPSASLFGVTSDVDGIPEGIPVCGIAGDQQAALFGQRCWRPGEAKCTHGTGSFLLQNTGQELARSSNGLISTLACGPGGAVCYALEGSVFVSGSAVQWLRDGLGLISSASETAEIAASVPDSGGVYFVPALAGLGAPWWDQHARGAIYGITRATTKAHIVRATLEAIAYQTADVLRAMSADSGLIPCSLRVDGGASANDLLCQMMADICQIEIVLPAAVETTALGAMYLAGIGGGLWPEPPEPLEGLEPRHFEPRISPDQAESMYAGWTEAVERTLRRDQA